MSEPSWKKFERRVAEHLGGKRQPLDGSREQADVVVRDVFVVQCKRRDCPKTLLDWIAGIRRTAARRVDPVSGLTPTGIVVWKPKGMRDRDALVLLALEDWIALHGPCETGESET